MFQLTDQEVTVLKSQSVISNNRKGRGGRRSRPYAFTEQGVAMLSSVLHSDTAIQVNVEIMRAFVRIRRAALVSQELVKVGLVPYLLSGQTASPMPHTRDCGLLHHLGGL
jgi:hypothetical protein